ncbi:MAG TPA: HAMP domain-containing sensor histidine kinase, partial [Gemmatimonadales bacterium]|nr:HAMP domain-containing sensor histidine kinase [Gemmatimonadales bacterium]
MSSRLPRRVNLLWILGALLGAAAIHGTFRAIHHPVPSGPIMDHFAEATALFSVAVAEGRLQALARESSLPAGGLTLHFVTDSSGGHWATLTAAGGASIRIEAHALATRLFQPESHSEFNSALAITTGPGDTLYRTPGPDQPYHATIHPRGVLAELAVTSALPESPGMLASFRSISRDQLWFSGLLLAAAILAIVIAAVSSRREAMLARARSDFIAGVSHELRMPLAQILLASETLALEREPDAERRLGLATSIVREARRLAGLVDNVLLVARSGAVALRPSLATVSVEELFAEVGDSVQLAVEDAGQRLAVGAAPGIAVRGDRQLLRQALINLIDNARKYGTPGQTIRIGAD